MEIKQQPPVKRCAILIGNDRWGGNILPGVSRDIDSIHEFLLSPIGGAWETGEIHPIVRAISKEAFLDLIKRVESESDYLFIYFGGHGELGRNGSPLFVLPGGDEILLSDIRSQVSNKPVLMISDSCQAFPVFDKGGKMICESQHLFSTGDATEMFKARHRFDQILRELPPMFTYASAVSPGQTAGESDDGGHYTQALLKSCKDVIEDKDLESDVYGICFPQTMARRSVIIRTKGKQVPYISGYTRTYQPPFMVKL